MQNTGHLSRLDLLLFLDLWSWDAWSVLELLRSLFESWLAACTAEEISLAFIVREHLVLGGFFDVNRVLWHDSALDFFWRLVCECRYYEGSGCEGDQNLFHV